MKDMPEQRPETDTRTWPRPRPSLVAGAIGLLVLAAAVSLAHPFGTGTAGGSLNAGASQLGARCSGASAPTLRVDYPTRGGRATWAVAQQVGESTSCPNDDARSY